MSKKDKNIKILLVEDDIYMNRIIKNYMESEGYEIDTALSYKSALKNIYDGSIKYDVLIVDFRLGDENGKTGLDFHDKARKKIPELKTIMISAFGSYQLKKDAFKKGIDKFLDKPFFLEDLKCALKN